MAPGGGGAPGGTLEESDKAALSPIAKDIAGYRLRLVDTEEGSPDDRPIRGKPYH